MRTAASEAAFYKLVAIVPDVDGQRRYVSIYDGMTTYALGVRTSPRNGCWVCPDLLTCVQHAASLPSHAALFAAPRAIMQVRCWGVAPTRVHADTATKVCFAHCLPIALLPYTAAAQPNTPAGDDLTDSEVRALNDEGPATAPPARPSMLRLSAGEAARRYGSDGGIRLQAMTVGLHEDVLYAEARLARIRAMSFDNRADQGEDPPAWVQRALARSQSQSRVARQHGRRPPAPRIRSAALPVPAS